MAVGAGRDIAAGFLDHHLIFCRIFSFHFFYVLLHRGRIDFSGLRTHAFVRNKQGAKA